MIQLAWRFLLFQKDSALAQWYRTRTEGAGKNRKTMIVALARKLLIDLWAAATTWRGSGGRRIASGVRGKLSKGKLSEADEQNIVGIR